MFFTDEELHAKTLIEEGRRLEREQNSRELREERENATRMLRRMLQQMIKAKWQLPENVLDRLNSENDAARLQAWMESTINCPSAEVFKQMILEEKR